VPHVGLLSLENPHLCDDAVPPGTLAAHGLWEGVREAGGEPILRGGMPGYPEGGKALVREWIADYAHISCAGRILSSYGTELDALLLSARGTEEMAGLLLAALRLNLPTIVAPVSGRPFDTVPYALGLTPLTRDPAEVAVAVARGGEPRVRDLINSFSLANALRTGLAAGGGPELLVHLAAIAREAGEPDFPRMIRVLAPESPALVSPAAINVVELLSYIGDTLHDVRTVEGRLSETLPVSGDGEREVGNRLRFVAGRVSGVEAVASAPPCVDEIAGVCRIFASEKEAARAVEADKVGAGELLVVGGCGPRGGPGLLRLDLLAQTLRESSIDESISVITDGLPPAEARGTWISLVSPEAAAGGVIWRLRDGDTLRIDLVEGRIRTGVPADEMERRDPYEVPEPDGANYAARYARSALPALEGAGFG
jgi:dihydroxy-acid dehydratase